MKQTLNCAHHGCAVETKYLDKPQRAKAYRLVCLSNSENPREKKGTVEMYHPCWMSLVKTFGGEKFTNVK